METTTISSYEWNARLWEYFTALDSLFPNQNWAGELKDLIRVEERIFEKLYRGTNTYCASIPRERDWQTTGLREQIVEQVRELNGRTPDTQVKSQH
uniref:hypothetical protein n=1 Tax=Salinigranum halophilum TaxID=2565931 RepID=UPI0010A904E2